MKFIQSLNLETVSQLLRHANLPTTDLTNEKLKHFVGIQSDDSLMGIVGIELFKPYALLRSLLVIEAARGRSFGLQLLTHIEELAREEKIKEIYLLTTTAEKFFTKHSYQTIKRSLAPSSIQSSSEFSDICPASATVMKKIL